MTLNATELAAVAADLSARLRGAVVQRVREQEQHSERLALRLRQPGENLQLLIDIAADTCRAHLVDDMPPAPGEPSAFVMLLRKHLGGAAIDGVATLDGDRVLCIALRRGDEAHTLVAELTGRHANVFLINHDGVVLGSMRPNRSRRRDLRPGRPWSPPAPLDGPRPPLRDGWPEHDFHTWLAERYGDRADDRDETAARDAAARRIRRQRQRMQRRVEAIERDLARADDAEAMQRRGELLQGAFGRVERGATTVEVQDWYAEGAPMVTIELDPALSLHENIERLFHHARRFRRGRATAEQRLLEAMETVETLDDALSRLDDGADPDELVAGLERQRVLPPPKRAATKRGRDEAPRLPYHPFRSSDGHDILVGRGGADNDRLTFGTARGRDVWLHARDWPGAHVILVMPSGGDPPPRALHEAAVLAAHFSRGAADGVVSVHWTRRSDVRKPKGMPPGRVTLSGARGIDVRLDPDEVQRVLALAVPS